METTLTIRLKGEPAEILNALIEKGYFASKNEAIRASLIFYAMQLGLISPKDIHTRIKAQIRGSRIRYSKKDVKKQLKAIGK